MIESSVPSWILKGKLKDKLQLIYWYLCGKITFLLNFYTVNKTYSQYFLVSV